MKLYKDGKTTNALKEQIPIFLEHGWSKTPPEEEIAEEVKEEVKEEETKTETTKPRAIKKKTTAKE